MMIKKPYLLFLGDAPDDLAAKVAQGIKDWRPENVIGKLSLPSCQAQMDLPEMSLAVARAAGAETLVIGVANRGVWQGASSPPIGSTARLFGAWAWARAWG